ncbi:MAG TPA: D-aminoacylase, partial [Sphingomonadales bacterium]
LIREGLWADVVIFDLDRIADKADWENPLAFPEGVETVLVNGVVVVKDGRHTGAKPGRVLRGPGHQAAE